MARSRQYAERFKMKWMTSLSTAIVSSYREVEIGIAIWFGPSQIARYHIVRREDSALTFHGHGIPGQTTESGIIF
jgi:hypothetical protein